MSKKYVIELNDPVYYDGEGEYYPVTKIPWWAIAATNVAKMEPIDDVLKEAEQRGAEKAWRLAQSVYKVNKNGMDDVLAYNGRDLLGLPYEEAVKRYEDWKAKQDKPDGIVLCRDCKFSGGEEPCGMVDFWNTPDDYCSRGERKDD